MNAATCTQSEQWLRSASRQPPARCSAAALLLLHTLPAAVKRLQPRKKGFSHARYLVT